MHIVYIIVVVLLIVFAYFVGKKHGTYYKPLSPVSTIKAIVYIATLTRSIGSSEKLSNDKLCDRVSETFSNAVANAGNWLINKPEAEEMYKMGGTDVVVNETIRILNFINDNWRCK